MKTTDKNILIAEFMKWDILNDMTYSEATKGKWIELDKLKFNSNWNWLMEVVEKIENTEMTGFKILDEFRIESFQVVVRAWITPKHKLYKLIEIKESKIEAVYNAVVSFIEWYNSAEKK